MINFLLSSISYLLLQSKLQVGLDGYWQVSSQVVEHRVVFEEHAHLFTTSVRHPQESYHILDNRTNELKTFVIDAEKGVAAVCGLFQSAAAFSSSTATGRNDDIKLDIAVEERLHLQEQAQRLVDSYSIDTWTMDHIPLLVNISSSCVVMSLGRSRPHSMWMIADIAGTTPIWYGIHEHHPLTQQSTVVISTDYLVLPQYGVRYPSVTAPGSVFGIQLVVDGRSKSIYEINPIRQKDGYHGRTAVRDSQIDVQYVTGQDFSQVKEEVFHKYYHLLWREAQLVGQQVVHSIPQLPEGHLVLTETDQDYMSSWMLYAVLDKLNVSRLVRFAPPLVIQPDEAQLPKELVELAAYFPRVDAGTLLKRKVVSFLQRALHRWQLCRPFGFVHTGTSPVYIAHQDGLESSAIDIYLQNLLCSKFGTRLVYPWSDLSYQALLKSTKSKSRSLLNKAMNYLLLHQNVLHNESLAQQAVNGVKVLSDKQLRCEMSGACFHEIVYFHRSNASLSQNQRVLKMTKSVSNLYLQLQSEQKRNESLQNWYTAIFASEIENELKQQQQQQEQLLHELPSSFSAEEISSSPANTTSNDAQSKSQSKAYLKINLKREKTEITTRLDALASIHANSNRQIVIVMATKGYYGLLHNFLCSIDSIYSTFTHKPFLVITSDDEIEALGHQFGVAVMNTQKDLSFAGSFALPSAHFGTVTYQQLMLIRTTITMELLWLSYRPIIADIDTVWLQDPFKMLQYIGMDRDLQEPVSATNSDADSAQSSKDESKGTSNSSQISSFEIHDQIRAIVPLTNQSMPYDIAITDDGGEVCGCFVAVNPTKYGLAFWFTIYQRHQKLVQQASQSKNSIHFTDSEQKILTSLIYKQQYRENLHYRLLSLDAFPSGRIFFQNNLYQDFFQSQQKQVSDSSIHVIHNNFIIGLENKIHRFERYGLWYYQPPFLRDSNQLYNYYGPQYCRSKRPRGETKTSSMIQTRYLEDVDVITELSVNVVAPIHNDMHFTRPPPPSIFTPIGQKVAKDSIFLTLVEGDPLHHHSKYQRDEVGSPYSYTVTSSNSKQDDDFTPLVENNYFAYMKSDPPSFLAFSYMVLGEKNFHPDQSRMFTYTFLSANRDRALLKNAQGDTAKESEDMEESVEISLDITENRDYFAVDYKAIHPSIANEHALEYLLHGNMHPQHRLPNEHDHLRLVQSPIASFYRHHFREGEFSSLGEYVSSTAIQYTIKILAFNRPQSLQRLVQSLLAVDFSFYFHPNDENHDEPKSISLEFIIDGNRTAKEYEDVQEVIAIAHAFEWPHGNKSVTVRESNFGTLNQWLNSWIPANDHEVGIILEDDLELSPYYFRYIDKVVRKYYQSNLQQKKLQFDIFQEVLRRIALHKQQQTEEKTSSNDSSSIDDLLDFSSFVARFVGTPVMYGLCMQRQTVDSLRAGAKLKVKTAHRPFLYSLVGSWGPVFFPMMWHAFRAWVFFVSEHAPNSQPIIMYEEMLTNYYYKQNQNIWTPYFIQFAHIFSAKCIYPNLPSDLTLVNNHREKGENYAHSLGAYASLVSNEMLAAANIPLDVYHVPVTNHSHEAMIEQQYHMNLEDLRFALYYLPSLRELSRWQYDFNLRRVGIPGSENSLPKAYSPTSNNGFIYLYYDQVQVMLDWYQGFLQISTLDVKNSRGFPHLSVDHWVEVARMLEGYLTPITSITHLEANPLLWMLGNTYQLYEHHVLTLYDLCPTFDQGRALFEEAPKPFGIGLGETSWFSCESLHVRADQKNESNNSRSALVLHWPLFVEAVEWQLLEKLILQEADSPFEHLIIIGACSSAPLSISFGTSSVKVEYFQVHSLCDVEPVDRGVVLYRLKAKLQNLVRSVYHRKTMARRLSPSLFERWLATY